MGTTYTSPGRGYYGPIEQVQHSFDHNEGELVTFHIGHGVMREYRVDARDDELALLRQVPRVRLPRLTH